MTTAHDAMIYCCKNAGEINLTKPIDNTGMLKGEQRAIAISKHYLNRLTRVNVSKEIAQEAHLIAWKALVLEKYQVIRREIEVINNKKPTNW